MDTGEGGIILFEDRGTPHTAEDSLELAAALGDRSTLTATGLPR